MIKYRVIYVGQTTAYKNGQEIHVPKKNKTIEQIANYINLKANLDFTDLGYLSVDENEMSFGAYMDGITYDTPILIIKKING